MANQLAVSPATNAYLFSLLYTELNCRSHIQNPQTQIPQVCAESYKPALGLITKRETTKLLLKERKFLIS